MGSFLLGVLRASAFPWGSICAKFMPMIDRIPEHYKVKARVIAADVERAFTAHPQATGETYRQHLWFTFTMSARFLYTTLVLLIHGLFPFLLARAASTEIERIYTIMRGRVPKARRDVIDIDYQV
jgi:hypothetical protein